VRRPRFSIGGLMTWVLILAVDFAAVRFLVTVSEVAGRLAVLLLVGALPMANLLAFGLLRLFSRRPATGAKPLFWRGFVVCGAVAFLLFVACAVLATDALFGAVDRITWPFQPRNGVLTPLTALVPLGALLLLVAPQLIPALFGGWFNRRFKLTISRRSQLAPAPIGKQSLITPWFEWARPKYPFLFTDVKWPVWLVPGSLNEPIARSDPDPTPSQAVPRNT
jgi:hypothetical protein